MDNLVKRLQIVTHGMSQSQIDTNSEAADRIKELEKGKPQYSVCASGKHPYIFATSKMVTWCPECQKKEAQAQLAETESLYNKLQVVACKNNNRALKAEAQLDAVRGLPEKLRKNAKREGIQDFESRAWYALANTVEQALRENDE